MKYVVVLGDGMADEPLQELGGKTVLSYSNIPNINSLAEKSELGLVYTIPEGMKPGSDTANLAVLGYNPEKYYTGRSPLEALSIGVDMETSDIAIRANIVTVSEENIPYGEKTIIDHSSSEISTEDAAILLDAVKEELETSEYQYYTGTSYRHLLLWKNGKTAELTPPHDILGKKIGAFLPEEKALKDMMEKSYEILNNHPINIKRAEKGLNKANSLWFWGAGTKPALDNFEEKTGKKGAMISAVDLLKGIAIGAGMKNIEVDGADGTLHTNYTGKAEAAADVLLRENYDFVYVHIEAPDEMGHQGNIQNKIQAVEWIDEKVVKVLLEKLEQSKEEFRIMVLPDHPTPIACRTHTSSPVPYLIYDSRAPRNEKWTYNEAEAEKSGNKVQEGYRLIDRLLELI